MVAKAETRAPKPNKTKNIIAYKELAVTPAQIIGVALRTAVVETIKKPRSLSKDNRKAQMRTMISPHILHSLEKLACGLGNFYLVALSN